MSIRSESSASRSTAASPTDSRSPLSRLDSLQALAGEGLSESFQSTDTIRHRPDGDYGTISSSQLLPPVADATTPVQDRPQHRQAAGATASISSATRSPLLGPDRGRGRPRRPALPRRASSNAQGRPRGSVFSVDDAASEVEADELERKVSHPQTPGLRRRTTGQQILRLHGGGGGGGSRDDGLDDEAMTSPAFAPKPFGTPRVDSMAESSILEELGEGINDLGALDDDVAGDDGDNLGVGSGAQRNDANDDDEDDGDANDDDDDDDDGDISDAESFTLKDRQQAINETHPFGIRLWKPALYKKDRSVQKTAEGDIHSSPGGHVNNWLLFFNIMWTIFFGVWLSLIAFTGAAMCLLFAAAPSGREYGRVLWGLSGYLFYPFGKFVRLEQQEPYLDEDQGEGRSISEYEQWQNGDLEYGRLFFGPERSRSLVGRSRRSIGSEPNETDSLLDSRSAGRRSRRSRRSNDSDLADHSQDGDLPRMKRRLFGRGQWNVGRVIFFLFFYLLITPSLFIASGICWLLVFWIPMGRVTMLLFDHLRRHPLALTFESDIATARAPAAPQSSIIVCTYRAVGLKYWKYTVDGTNIFLINLMAVVMFVILDWAVLDRMLELDNVLTSSAFLFVAGLLSIIPLAYFIGQAVASISAQSSMGVGAAINAFFSTIVEVFLYCVALRQGKAQLVEGSIIGSIFAGILFLPGLSMCFGAIKRKTQRFNARSAGVTSTMLLFAVIAAFCPTLFYQIYGTHQLNCLDCVESVDPRQGDGRDCRRCYFSQTPAIDDRFYLEAVRPYCYLAASLLFLSYAIGLWFTLRTHAAVIWNAEVEEKQQQPQPQPQPHAFSSVAGPRHSVGAGGAAAESSGVDTRDSHLYWRILGQSLKPAPRQERQERQEAAGTATGTAAGAAAVPPFKTAGSDGDSIQNLMRIPGFTEAENRSVTHQVADMAATAAAIASRDRDVRFPRRPSAQGSVPTAGGGSIGPGGQSGARPPPIRATAVFPDHEDLGASAGGGGGGGGDHSGHDAPNWSRKKSAVILMCATALYAVIAEILVDSVDFVLDGFAIDEKFLGITLFALVPNTTEFLNAISFAMNGNIALSMEIGSAYALQVCLLQIPALVLFSAAFPAVGADAARFTFSLLFPQWDMISVILCVFLLSYMYGEGKSNYFKGSILLMSYLVVVSGFYFSGYMTSLDLESTGLRRFDTLGLDGRYVSYGRSFKTAGQSRSGVAF